MLTALSQGVQQGACDNWADAEQSCKTLYVGKKSKTLEVVGLLLRSYSDLGFENSKAICVSVRLCGISHVSLNSVRRA